MIELKYKNWKDITINVYQKLQNLNLNRSSDIIDEIDDNVKILSILCDVDEDTIADLEVGEYKTLVSQCAFLNEMPKVQIKDEYWINNKLYQVQYGVQDMTMAQYIDYQTYLKDSSKYTKEIVSCFVIPKGKKYGEDYDLNETIEDIGNYFSIVDALSVCFFFTMLFRSLTTATLGCLVKKMKRGKRKMNKEQQVQVQRAIDELNKVIHLVKSGDGYIG